MIYKSNMIDGEVVKRHMWVDLLNALWMYKKLYIRDKTSRSCNSGCDSSLVVLQRRFVCCIKVLTI